MPQIIVTADQPTEDGEPTIMLRERVNVSDFESEHFAAQLLERLGWAVGDADEVNRHRPRRSTRRPQGPSHRPRGFDAAPRDLAVSGPPARPVS